MATFRQADEAAVALVQELIQTTHKDLKEAGVRLGVLFAFAPVSEKTGEPTGHALQKGGYPAAALVRVVSHKDRVAGLPDAIISVDGIQWEEWNDARRRAVLDHEITHLLLQRDEEGNVKLDDCHRPKLKLRAHDFELGGFHEIAERHGTAALEAQAFTDLHRQWSQKLFPWG